MQVIETTAVLKYISPKNRWRSDAIGDLARDVHSDPSWPKKANTWKEVSVLLPSSACDGASRALRKAWREYELYVGGPSQIDHGVYVARG